MNKLKNLDYILLVLIFTLIFFFILFIFRFLDDNTLTSWKWVFSGVGIGKIFLFLLLGTILSFFFARTSCPEQHPRIFLFLLSFSITLPLWREPEVILDTSRYFLQAKYLEVYGVRYFFQEWGKEIRTWTDMPLVPLFYGLIFKFLGEVRGYIQFFTTLLFSLTVVITFLIGKTLWDEEKGFYAGLLLMGIPYLPTQVPLMLVDVPTMFLMTLSVYSFLKALERGGPLWIALSSLTIFFTIFAKYSAWLMLAVIPVTALTYRPKGIRINLYRSAVIAMIAGLLSGVVFLLKYDLFLEQINFLRTYQWSGLRRWQESFISTFLFQIHPFISIAAGYAIYAAIKKRDARFLIAGWFAIFVFLLQVKRIRYIIPLFPLFSLMASYGLNEIKEKKLKRYIGYCAVVSSIVILLNLFLPFLQRMSMANLKEAGEYLDTLEGETIEVYTLPQKRSIGNTVVAVPILDLYTRKRVFYCQRPFYIRSERVKTSSLRFTWDFKNPAFYSSGEGCYKAPLFVIISSQPGEKLPEDVDKRMEGLKVLKKFAEYTGVFRYKTFVTVYGSD